MNRIWLVLAMAAPVALSSCLHSDPLAERVRESRQQGVIALKEDPAKTIVRRDSDLQDDSVMIDAVTEAGVSEDPRCHADMAQISADETETQNMPAARADINCAHSTIRFHEADMGGVDMGEGILSDSEAALLGGSVSPEVRFRSLTGNGLNPEGFDPSGELTRIGRGATPQSDQALAIASDILAQQGVAGLIPEDAPEAGPGLEAYVNGGVPPNTAP